MADKSESSFKETVVEAIRNRRRMLLVNPVAQRRFVLSLSLPVLLVLLAVGTWIFWVQSNAYADAGALPSFLPLGIGLFVGILAFGATLVVQALRVSHRVQGAAYRLVKSMERIREGDLDFTVKLRNNDHLHDVAAELNRLMEWIRTRVEHARADEASTTASGTGAPETEQAIGSTAKS